MIEPASKRMMIEVAEHYESLVRRAEKDCVNRQIRERLSCPDANDGKALRRS